MFSCTSCQERYTVEDVKSGRYFVSTSTCLDCYKKMAKSRVRCFGKEKMYSTVAVACNECIDERICRTVIKHRKDF